MRLLTLLTSVVFAAIGGGLTATWLQRPADESPVPTRADAMLDAATQAALPKVAQAALPAQVNGAPLPSLAPMLEKVMPSVVNVYTKQVVRARSGGPFDDPFFRRFFGYPDMPQERVTQSLGSGVVVDAERGYVLTNHHVIADADEVSVQLSDGRTVEAEFIGSDQDTDVALIRIPVKNLTPLTLADSGDLRVGDFVVAVGNPFGLGQTVTSGIVSAVGRSGLQGLGFQNFIQTDASINPGNSGGALVNLRGELVGINTASFNPRGSAAGNIGLGFAIPANLAREVMRQLLVYGEVKRGSLGIDTIDINPRVAAELGIDEKQQGALVARVYRQSPGEAAGLRPGDVITAIEDKRVDGASALRNTEGLLPIGKPVKLTVQRGKELKTLNASLSEQPKKLNGAKLDERLSGATFGDLAERFRQGGVAGVVVDEVESGSRAAINRLRPGDQILGINGREVTSLNAFREALGSSPKELVLFVRRGYDQGNLPMR